MQYFAILKFFQICNFPNSNTLKKMLITVKNYFYKFDLNKYQRFIKKKTDLI